MGARTTRTSKDKVKIIEAHLLPRPGLHVSTASRFLCALAAAHDCVAASEYEICRAANRYRDAYPAVCCKGADLAWLGNDCFAHSIQDDDMLLGKPACFAVLQVKCYGEMSVKIPTPRILSCGFNCVCVEVKDQHQGPDGAEAAPSPSCHATNCKIHGRWRGSCLILRIAGGLETCLGPQWAVFEYAKMLNGPRRELS
ncbi:hypothetical protein CI102_11799 [Trichoderma harzianum]|nr:hypothetical protein CI102_11799 [Trichoderma harzianum]